MRIISLRRVRFDEFGLRRAPADTMLPRLAAAMVFLAALAIAGWMGGAALVGHWERNVGSGLTIQVPRPDEFVVAGSGTRLQAVKSLLIAVPGVTSATVLSDAQLNTLLRPWLGADLNDLAVPVPAIIAVHTAGEPVDLVSLTVRLDREAPGTILDDYGHWGGRLGELTRSLQLCSGLVLLIVTFVTGAVIAVATRSSLALHKEAIMIVHQLGATDGYITHRFAVRAAALALSGGAIGGLFALPVVFMLSAVAAPLAGENAPPATPVQAFAFLPLLLWLLPVILPVAAAGIAYIATHIMMHRWLGQLP